MKFNAKNITENLFGYALGLAGLFVTVWVVGKAWHSSDDK